MNEWARAALNNVSNNVMQCNANGSSSSSCGDEARRRQATTVVGHKKPQKALPQLRTTRCTY